MAKPAPNKVRIRSKSLIKVLVISLLAHVAILLTIGGVVIFSAATQDSVEFEAPTAIPEQPPQVPIQIKINSNPTPPKKVIAAPAVSVIDISDIEVPTISQNSRVAFGTGELGGNWSTIEAKMPDIDFFGVKTSSQSIVFVMDISGSMIGDERGPEGFKIVADEILKVLQSMSDNGSQTKFNIIGFAGGVETLSGSVREINEATIQRTKNWLRRMDPAKALKRDQTFDSIDWNKYQDGLHAGTRTDLALKKAFSMNPEQIILLSDGEPTGVSVDEILMLTAKLQEKQPNPVKINTISYRSKDGRSFMNALASRNSGEYLAVE
ncbi:vWA domain-containing protein [Cerasicoccus fimbriatus]|uniref:vWA domain-containing protein n=1 Tax=Cerasicoccus fimbriatus TaxID=3014554 RepID=UPI0022B5DFFC|nr:vWA domain-containing protein [Cerasicoccus sp. TK19100]